MVPKNLRNKIFFLMVFLFPLTSFAKSYEKQNYFASTRSGKVNVRSGPNLNYQVKHVLNHKGIPIKVIGEFDNWLEIVDYEGTEGWVNKNLITKKRTMIIKTSEAFIYIYKENSSDSKKIAKIENLALVDFKKCRNFWCNIENKDAAGWVKIKNVWGY
jgi:SH3-like domain-containing protein